MTNELKPCPFAKLDEKHHIDVIETHPGYGYIYCRNCDFDFPSEESIPLDVLIERWNTRAERTCNVKPLPLSGFTEFECSKCCGTIRQLSNYCPHCGAKVVSNNARR